MIETAELLRDFGGEFELDPGLIYLNHAAVAPWPRRGAEAVCAFARENVRFGASHYPRWLEQVALLKRRLAELINAAHEDDIALLKNTSEGLSLVAYGLDWRNGDNVVIPRQEFPSNRVVWQSLASQGVEIRMAELHKAADPEQVIMQLTDRHTKLISVSHVQYDNGLRLDLSRLGAFCRNRNILFCVDAIQSLGCIAFDVNAFHVDFVTADAHKWLLGPEGIALFYCRPDLRERLRLHEYGWHMVEDAENFTQSSWKVAKSARRFECGSPNMLGVVALLAGVELLAEIGLDLVSERVLEHSRFLHGALGQLAGMEIMSDTREGRFAGIVTFRHRSLESDVLVSEMKKNRIICAARGGGIRFSPHFYTTRDQLAQAVETVKNASRTLC